MPTPMRYVLLSGYVGKRLPTPWTNHRDYPLRHVILVYPLSERRVACKNCLYTEFEALKRRRGISDNTQKKQPWESGTPNY